LYAPTLCEEEGVPSCQACVELTQRGTYSCADLHADRFKAHHCFGADPKRCRSREHQCGETRRRRRFHQVRRTIHRGLSQLGSAMRLDPLSNGQGYSVLIRYGSKCRKRCTVPFADRTVAVARASELVSLERELAKDKCDRAMGAQCLERAASADAD